jgi:hypothetical protein
MKPLLCLEHPEPSSLEPSSPLLCVFTVFDSSFNLPPESYTHHTLLTLHTYYPHHLAALVVLLLA